MARRASLAEDEDGWGKSNRGDDDIDLDITPMIDVTFLLLIFFMVTSTMQGTPEIDVPPARHGDAADTTKATMIDVKKPEGTGEPTILIEEVEATLDDVRTKVREALDEGNTQVIIMADREVPHGFVQQVARAVVEFEGVTFSIGVRDKK